MAGIQLGSSFRLSSPVPHLANASFPDAPTRLAAGQLRHVSWRYSQDSPDAHYRIKPLAVCFLADGVTAATQFGTWGTLEAHWRIVPISSDDLPESATPTNKYYTDARSVLKADLVNGIVPASQLPPVTASTALAQATATTLGTVRGNGFTGATGNVIVNTDGSMTAPAATTSAAYTLPQAAANTLGGLKLGANLALNTTSGQVDAGATFASIAGQPTDNTNLSTALSARFNNRGAWAASTLYQPNDAVSSNGATYYNSGLAFTSGATFPAPNWTAFTSPLYATFGQATDGPVTQAAVTNAFLQMQAPLVVNNPDGTTQYFTSWPGPAVLQPGATVVVRTNFDAGSLLVVQSYTSIRIEAGAVLSCQRTVIQFNDTGVGPGRMVFSGPGTLRGNINCYNGPTFKLHLTNLRHEGMFFNDSGGATASALTPDVKWSNVVCVPPTTYCYLNTLSRNGAGAYCLYFRYRFYQCRFEVSGISPATVAITNARANTPACAFNLGAINYAPNAVQDASDKANCLLEASGCTFLGDGISSNSVLGNYGGFAVLRFATSTVYGIAAPPDATDPAFTSFGLPGDTYSVLPPLPSITIDFNAETVRTLTIATAGAVTFTGAANIALLKTKELYISNTSGAAIALSFTGGWSFFPGPAPTSLAAGKQAVLTLRSLGTTDATIKAAYVAQA